DMTFDYLKMFLINVPAAGDWCCYSRIILPPRWHQ
ncbi:hypothetical protein M8C21_000213, partial [Ambrosia artemisiifolia]